VPGRAEIEVRLSFLPGETEASIRQEVIARVNAVAQRSPWLREHPPKIAFFGWHTAPWLQDERHPFVQEFAQCVRALRADATLATMRPWASDPPPILAGGTAGLDTRFAGLYGIPAVAWGPKGGNMHGADEFVDLDSVIAVAHALAVFAARWCGTVTD
jgi:acetylornithine deacetylase